MCWSLGPDDVVPDDPRIAVAEPYAMVDVDLYARRLAACDLLALPFDPDGEMLATGVASDVIGLGLRRAGVGVGLPRRACSARPASRWATRSRASPPPSTRSRREQIAEAQAASRALQDEQSWSVVAERTLALFEDVVATRAARRFA